MCKIWKTVSILTRQSMNFLIIIVRKGIAGKWLNDMKTLKNFHLVEISLLEHFKQHYNMET